MVLDGRLTEDGDEDSLEVSVEKKYEFVNKVKVFWPRPDDAFKVKPMVIPDMIPRGNIPMDVMNSPRLNSKMAN